ncbi:MAG: 2TM domain-containing protein [Flavobacterium sp.]
MGIVMERNYTEEDRYYKAKKRVDEIKGFYGNLVAYIAVNAFFLILNLLTSPEHLWFYWPMLGWGIGVLFHGLRVFNSLPFFGKDWEERKLQELMDKDKESKRNFK